MRVIQNDLEVRPRRTRLARRLRVRWLGARRGALSLRERAALRLAPWLAEGD